MSAVRFSHASALRNAPHESVCGDSGDVFVGANHTLAVVADGLGHGPDARVASLRAVEVAAENIDSPLEALMLLMDRALASTRGAAVSILRLEHGARTISFVGIGNVECRALSAHSIQPLAMPGIVGRKFRRARLWSYPVTVGDDLVLVTDGISSRVELERCDAPEALANAVLTRFARGTDDAFVLALRVVPA